jgi:hypothetical protein
MTNGLIAIEERITLRFADGSRVVLTHEQSTGCWPGGYAYAYAHRLIEDGTPSFRRYAADFAREELCVLWRGHRKRAAARTTGGNS